MAQQYSKNVVKKQAVLILAHNQVSLLKKLILQLDCKDIDIFLHIDKSLKRFNCSELSGLVKYSDICIYQKFDIKWGAFSMAEAEIFLLKEAIKKKYYYYHLISGVDLPIKKIDKIVMYFSHQNAQFVHFVGQSVPDNILERCKYYWFFTQFMGRAGGKYDEISLKIQRLIGINRLKKQNDVVQWGSQWFSITNEFAQYVIEKEKWIKKTFKCSCCCDEMFIQTLLFNSSFNDKIYNKSFNDNYDSNKRCIDWKRGTPYVFSNDDDIQILLKSNAIFARKFDYELYPQIVDGLIKKIN